MNAFATIDSLFSAAPHGTLPLNLMAEEFLYPELIIGGEGNQSDDRAIAGPVDALIEGDSLLVVDRIESVVFILDKETGKIRRVVARKGAGPDELLNPVGIVATTGAILVRDLGNSRIQVYTRTLEYKDSFPDLAWGPPTTFTSSGEYLLMNRSLNDDSAIEVRRARAPFELIPLDIVPRVMPLGTEPSSFNIVTLASNSRGDVVYGYNNLPYLFFLDDKFALKASLEFVGEVADDLNRRLKETKGPNGEQGYPGFISALSLAEDGRVYFRYRSTLFVIADGPEGYVVEKTLRLNYPTDDAIGQGDWIAASSLAIEGKILYVMARNDYRIFKFRLPE